MKASRDHSITPKGLRLFIIITSKGAIEVPSLSFTQEHPSTEGSIPYLDVLIHPEESTSINRKLTHTNLYTQRTALSDPSLEERAMAAPVNIS